MSVNGILDCKTMAGSVNGEVFYDLYKISSTSLDGKNPHSVVVMDNGSIHHDEEMIHEVGALVHFFCHLTHLTTTQ